jgi:ParB family chromosome partitioning protein
MTYDPGSRGATSYFEAALEIATRGAQVGAAGWPATGKGAARSWTGRPDSPGAARVAQPPPAHRARVCGDLRASSAAARPAAAGTRPTDRALGRRTGGAGTGSRFRAPLRPSSCVASITPNAASPPGLRSGDALEELKVSIQEVGLPSAIVVRESGSGSYEAVMGERPCGPPQALGLRRPFTAIFVRDTRDDAMLRDALLENIPPGQPESPGRGGRLPAAAGGSSEPPTRSCARGIGRSRPQISNTIRLLNLPARCPAARGRRRACPPGTPGRTLALERSEHSM